MNNYKYTIMTKSKMNNYKYTIMMDAPAWRSKALKSNNNLNWRHFHVSKYVEFEYEDLVKIQFISTHVGNIYVFRVPPNETVFRFVKVNEKYITKIPFLCFD